MAQMAGAVVAALLASVFTLGALWANRKMGLNPAKDSLIDTFEKTVRELRDQVADLRQGQADLQERVQTLELENESLLRENTVLRRENAELLRENNAFRRRLEGPSE